MPVTRLSVENYRSVRELRLPLKPINVIVGANGCGKSNLYQSLGLVRHAAAGTLALALAEEGGFPSVLWAGARKKGPVRLAVELELDTYVYRLELGLPNADPRYTVFHGDPQIKEESLIRVEGRKRIRLLDRGTSLCKLANLDGRSEIYPHFLSGSESALSQILNARDYPSLDDFRREVLKWRFYHNFRTDHESPLRQPQIGVRTFALANDGHDLAAALATVRENGDAKLLDDAISDAFPGAQLLVLAERSKFEVGMEFPGIDRPMSARELSDGTLRYLCLLAALLSPTPAPLIALNEPETSLNMDLLPPLARLIAAVGGRSQIWLTTHSAVLADGITELTGVQPFRLEKLDGATHRAGRPPGLAFSAEFD